MTAPRKTALPHPSQTRRIAALDIARGLALAGMVVFHLAYDIEFFGYLPPGTTHIGGWRVFSILIAGSFLFLSGVSLVIAHRDRLRLRRFLRRLGIVGGAAALVSLGTFAMFPTSFVYFGILHAIAVCSVLGLPFLRLPSWVCVAAAVFALWAPGALGSGAFNAPYLWWLGLSTETRPSVDFEPILPWVAPFLLGMALAKTSAFRRWEETARRGFVGLAPLEWAGRNSLFVYLIHQPVLIGLVWLAVQMT